MKTSHIQIRVSKEEKQSIKKAASRANLDMSQWILKKIFPALEEQFLKIIYELKDKQDTYERKHVLNELNSFLMKLSPKEIIIAVKEDHECNLNEFIDNYVASMIEFACYKKKVCTPKWVIKKEGLKNPYFGTDLIYLRPYLLIASPIPFRKRNIFIDSTCGDIV